MLIMKETLWKSNLNYVKDVPMMCVNFITSVIIVSGKKYEQLLSSCLLYSLRFCMF